MRAQTLEHRSERDQKARAYSRSIAEADVTRHIPASQTSESVDLIASFKSLDLSAAGIQVGVDEAIRLDTVLKMKITIPLTEQTFRLSGRVAWCHLNEVKRPSWLIGIQLVDCDPEELDSWRKAIEDL